MKTTSIKIFHLLLIGLLLITPKLYSATEDQQAKDRITINTELNGPGITVCGDLVTYTIEITNISAEPDLVTLTDMKLYPKLPNGVNYEAGSATSQEITFVENIDDPTDPYFIINEQLAPGASFKVSYQAKASCELIDLIQSCIDNEEDNCSATHNTRLEYQINNEALYYEVESSSYNVFYAQLSLDLPEDQKNISIEKINDITTRTFTITNSGNGSTDQVRLYINYNSDEQEDDDDVSLVSLKVNGAVIEPELGSDPLEFIIEGNLLDEDGIFDQGDDLVVEEKTQLNGCATSFETLFKAQWGCGGMSCNENSDDHVEAYFNAPAGSPFLNIEKIQNPQSGDFCGNNLILGYKYWNPGNGNQQASLDQVFDLIIDYTSDDTYFQITGNYKIINGNNIYEFSVNDGHIDFSTILEANQDPDGPGGLSDLDGDTYYDDLDVGDEIIIEVEISPQSPDYWAECTFQSKTILQGTANFNNNCNEGIFEEHNKFFYNKPYASKHVVEQTPLEEGESKVYTFESIVYGGGGEGLSIVCPNYQLKAIFDLPDGFKVVPGSKIYWANQNNNLTQLDYFINENDELEIDGGGWNGSYKIELTLDCEGVSEDTELQPSINWKMFMKCNQDCDKKIYVLCSEYTVLNQCAKCDGFSTTGFTFHRNTFGWYLDGVDYLTWGEINQNPPLANKDSEGILLHRALVGDEILVTLKSTYNNLDVLNGFINVNINYKGFTPEDLFLVKEEIKLTYNGDDHFFNDAIISISEENYQHTIKLEGLPINGLEPGQEVQIEFKLEVNDTDNLSAGKKVLSEFTSEVYMQNPDLHCNTFPSPDFWIFKQNYTQNGVSFSYNYDDEFTMGRIGIYGATSFPNELRPMIIVSKVSHQILDGFKLDENALDAIEIGHGSETPFEFTFENGWYTWEINDDWKIKNSTSSNLELKLNIKPDCDNGFDQPEAEKIYPVNPVINTHLEYKSKAYLNPTNLNEDLIIDSFSSSLKYMRNQDLLLTANSSQDGLNEKVYWPIQLTNNTNNWLLPDSAYASWIAIELDQQDGSTILLGAYDDLDPQGNPINPLETITYGKHMLIKLGDIEQGGFKDIYLEATYTNCDDGEQQDLYVFASWNGYKTYPNVEGANSITDPGVAYCEQPILTDTLQLNYKTANIQWSIIDPDPVSLCENATYGLLIESIGNANMYDIDALIELPEGVTYVPGSARYQYPFNENNDDDFIPTVDPNNENTWHIVHDNEANILGQSYLPGLHEENSNLRGMRLKFDVTSSCDFDPGMPIEITLKANTNCNDAILLKEERKLTLIDVTIDELTLDLEATSESCGSTTNQLHIDIQNIGDQPTAEEVVEVVLPAGVIYLPGLQDNCPMPYVIEQVANNDNTTSLKWTLPEGTIGAGQSAAFCLFTEVTDPQLTEVSYTAFTSMTAAATCINNNEECDLQPQTGNDEDSVIITPGFDVTITSNLSPPMCPGTEFQLTANVSIEGEYDYDWSPGNHANAPVIAVSPLVATEYSVVVSNAENCQENAAFSIFHLEIENPIISATKELFCPDEAISSTLTLNEPNNFINYQWYQDGFPIPGANQSFYKATTLGSYKIEAMSLEEGNCVLFSNVIDLTVDPNIPAVITTPDPLIYCLEENIQVTFTATPGYNNYAWYNNNDLIVGANSNVLQVNESGTYYVVTINQNGCIATSNNIEILAGPENFNATIATDDPLLYCSNEDFSVHLYITGNNNFDTYQWYRNNVAIPGATGNTYDAPFIGIYTLQTQLDGCEAISNEIEVKALPSPLPVIQLIKPATCADTEDGYAHIKIENGTAPFTWILYKGNQLVAQGMVNDADIHFNNMATGNYTVIVTDNSPLTCSDQVNFNIPHLGPQVSICASSVSCEPSEQDESIIHAKVTKPNMGPADIYYYSIFDHNTNAYLVQNEAQFFDTEFQFTVPYAEGQGYEFILHVSENNPCVIEPVPINIQPATLALGIEDEDNDNILQLCYVGDTKDVQVNAGINATACTNLGDLLYTYQLILDNQVVANVTDGPQVTLEGLAEGEYALRAQCITSPFNDCKKLIYFTIEASFMELTVDKKDVTCHGDEDGSATANIVGGYPPYGYEWYNENDVLLSTLPQIGGLAPGNYYVMVSDASGCEEPVTRDFTIDEPAPLPDPEFIVYEACYAKVSINVEEPIHPYTFDWVKFNEENLLDMELVWSASEGSEYVNIIGNVITCRSDPTFVKPGLYAVRVRDGNGCEVWTEHQKIEPPKIARTYNLCVSWQTRSLLVAPTPQLQIQDMATIAASGITQELNEQVEECIANTQSELAFTFEENCYSGDYLNDELGLSYGLKQHHYTLYYYDRAGNLMRTVPPKGVNPLQGIDITRENTPSHTMVTRYNYNNMGQLVAQNTPDGGTSQFIYNNLGQLRFSQNAEQAKPEHNTISYTKYDELGRVVEVGESELGGVPYPGIDDSDFTALAASDITSLDQQNLPMDEIYPTLEQNTAQRTNTYYNTLADNINYESKPQQYLRNRISYTTHENVDGELSATYYSYDAHGNVKWLANSLPGLGLRYTAYQYDLISGNVLGVDYNKGEVDQFFHRYSYDEDNRLLEVKTSRDGRLWDTDATYAYYDHGPLARVELGEDKVQGMDYTYTIHGWLKAVNHPNLESIYDPGRDGMGSSTVGKDAFGMALGYYEGDFASSGVAFNQNDPSKLTGLDLYNGNISSWTSGVTPLGQGNQYEGLTGHIYQYDGLNRIKTADFQYFDQNWQDTEDFDATYAYDPNGNISSLTRYAYDKGNGNTMDGLTYFYQDGNNRLDFVDDQAGYWGADDIDSQNEQNYKYDAIGNLVYDDFGEKIINIDWSVYGKVHRIKQWEDNIITTFTYDAAGNRIKKKATNGGNTTTTFYSRDASGNILAVYEKINNGPINLIEQPIYGSDRLGERKEVVDISGQLPESDVFTRRLGLKTYELKDHLSNVRATVSDYNLATVDGDDLVSPRADLSSYQHYYAFGMQQPGRSFNSSGTRYGFNGKEKDQNGEFGLTAYDYGFRIYNPALARFLSVDPLASSYAELTPYQYASNKPINSIDLDGLEARTAIKGEFVDGHWIMGSDHHITYTNAAEIQKQAQLAQKNIKPSYGTLRNNDITSTPQYQMFKFNVNTYGEAILPIDVSKRLIKGEEVPAWELGLEIAGIIPIAKIAKPLKYLDETIEIVSKVVKNSHGDEVVRAFVKNEDDLLKVAEDAAGGSLDNIKEIKPNWWEGKVGGKKKRIEWQPGGEASTAEGPHVKVMEWIEGAGKKGKGKWKTTEKYFIEGQEKYKP